nr:hypothetical protein [uncultured Shinella sp.]
MNTVDRNNHIATLRREGLTPPAIARKIGMSVSGVRYVLWAHEEVSTDLPIPEGISLRAARGLWLWVGRWPVPEEAAEIARARPDLIRTGMRRQDIEEVDAWLTSLGITQPAPVKR